MFWPNAVIHNARWQVSFPGMHKKTIKAITKMDDFNDELEELLKVIAICRDAGIITKNIYNIMLPRNVNAAAHPSSVVVDQLQTDAYIVDLIQNVILQIA